MQTPSWNLFNWGESREVEKWRTHLLVSKQAFYVLYFNRICCRDIPRQKAGIICTLHFHNVSFGCTSFSYSFGPDMAGMRILPLSRKHVSHFIPIWCTQSWVLDSVRSGPLFPMMHPIMHCEKYNRGSPDTGEVMTLIKNWWWSIQVTTARQQHMTKECLYLSVEKKYSG